MEMTSDLEMVFVAPFVGESDLIEVAGGIGWLLIDRYLDNTGQ